MGGVHSKEYARCARCGENLATFRSSLKLGDDTAKAYCQQMTHTQIENLYVDWEVKRLLKTLLRFTEDVRVRQKELEIYWSSCGECMTEAARPHFTKVPEGWLVDTRKTQYESVIL